MSAQYLTPLLAGFALGFGLILAIGAQNAFVLRQGLMRTHVLVVALTCAFADAFLIAIGVLGFGRLAQVAPWLVPVLTAAGVAFLLVYGALSFYRAWRGGSALDPAQAGRTPVMPTILTCLALTFGNPHVYLDTVVLVGSVAQQYGALAPVFGIGAVAASFVFFFVLAFGAQALAPLFARPGAWRVLEIVVGVIMWGLALKLVFT